MASTGVLSSKFLEQGNVLVSGKTKKSKKLMLTTKHIPNGTYYLHVLDGKEVQKEQIVIQH